MNVKRFLVEDMSEAVYKIKYALGPDAVIVNTRNVRRKGFKGLFQPPMIEVIAVADTRKPAPKIDTDTDYSYNKLLETKINSLSEQFESILSSAINSSSQNETKDDDIEIVRKEVPKVDEYSSNDYVKKLVEEEILEDIAVEIVREAEEIVRKRDDASMEEVIRYLLQSHLGDPKPVKLAKYRRKIIFLLGPTGVGKTTTIAKLASIFTLEKKAKVCLVACDTYRIAAVEQLKTYADILSIPLEVARNSEEFGKVLVKHEQDDIILVDTAGRSPTDPIRKEEVEPLFALCDSYEVYLVVSATTSYKGCLHILKNYEFLDNYKLLVTKVDESPTFGNIVNIAWHSKKSIGYVTTGQNVPDDIIELNEENLSYITKKII